MNLPGGTGFSGKQFWGIQLINNRHNDGGEKKVRVNADTELHISKVLVDVGYSKHKATCAFSIGVRYRTDPCGCEILEESCRHQKHGQCVLCIIKPEKKDEADLDLNFVGGKDVTFYYSCNCDCEYKCHDFTVNISGYEEVRS